MSAITKNKFVNPIDLEIMEAIIVAICSYYQVTEADLMERPVTSEQTNIRRIAFYLIITNTELKHWMIADRFKSSRYPVTSAKDIIALHRSIYKPTQNLINAIIGLANSFTKKHPWNIQ